MTPETAFAELSLRLAQAPAHVIQLPDSELKTWPEKAVTALKRQKIISRASARTYTRCPGCEIGCTMPVFFRPAPEGTVRGFIFCDRREEIGRIAVPREDLSQWHTHIGLIGRFLAARLSIRFSGQENNDLINIGVFKSRRKIRMLALKPEPEIQLVAGTNDLPLRDVIYFRDFNYEVDSEAIRILINMAGSGDPRYTPSTARQEIRKEETRQMHATWRKTYLRLKKQKPNMSDSWYALRIAAMEDIAKGRSPETIRKNMK